MSLHHRHRLATALWLLLGSFLTLEGILILLLVTSISRNVSIAIAPESQRDAPYPSDADRPVQFAAVIEAHAARSGWRPADLRAAGDAWFRAGDRHTALTFWQAAVAAGFNDPLLYRQLASVYLESRRWSEADGVLTRLIDASDGSPADRAWAYFQRGLIRLAEDAALAHADLRAALQLEPAFAASMSQLLELLDLQISEAFRLAATLSAAGLFDHAAAVMERAVSRGDLGDDQARGLAYAAVLSAQAGRRADAYIQRALTLRPDDGGVLFLAGLYWRLRGEYEASVSAFQAAAALNPTDPIVYAELGYAYEAFGDLESARFWLARAAAFADDENSYADDAARLAQSIDSILASMGIAVTAVNANPEGEAVESTGAAVHEPTQPVEADAELSSQADPVR